MRAKEIEMLFKKAQLFDANQRDGPIDTFPSATRIINTFVFSDEETLLRDLESISFTMECSGGSWLDGLRLINFVGFNLRNHLRSNLEGYRHKRIPFCEDSVFVTLWNSEAYSETDSETITTKENPMIPHSNTASPSPAVPTVLVESISVQSGISGYVSGAFQVGKMAVGLGVGASTARAMSKLICERLIELVPALKFVFEAKGASLFLPVIFSFLGGIPFHMKWIPEFVLSHHNQEKIAFAFLKAFGGSAVMLVGEIGEDFFKGILKSLKVTLDE